ncbi:hypothetical protein CITRIK5_70145 [Citricoccus sp. K5]|nr:hypothetical protein CITRIK5_70145 [Citricoccus sp. K5]
MADSPRGLVSGSGVRFKLRCGQPLDGPNVTPKVKTNLVILGHQAAWVSEWPPWVGRIGPVYTGARTRGAPTGAEIKPVEPDLVRTSEGMST